jgi:hypothetical protein
MGVGSWFSDHLNSVGGRLGITRWRKSGFAPSFSCTKLTTYFALDGILDKVEKVGVIQKTIVIVVVTKKKSQDSNRDRDTHLE